MPEDLFLAPRDIYMPDLMVVGDVLLGKLGYGTVSEAIDSATPFMYGKQFNNDGIEYWIRVAVPFHSPSSRHTGGDGPETSP